MGKLFNDTLKKWFNFNDEDYVFKEGYDDPTYLTFKVEFGDWGASVFESQLKNNKSMSQSLGRSNFMASKADYDALPIGLMNCPYEGIEDEQYYWQNGANEQSSVFNDNKVYSAFQYLRSRNEDTRAKYLLYFVNGLFEIQEKYPYIFKKISGLENLEQFDPKAGQRIKNEAKITLECIEGLNLKIRTLLEFYRKAAWDDVYQKWILPENMRQFKMIIYVFERRTFQDVETVEYDCNKCTSMKYGSLNADIPVKAYECCPCEFDIAGSQSWKGEYQSDFSGEAESSKICVKVQNVKTYYRNGLLSNTLNEYYDKNNIGSSNNQETTINSKISEIMIFDLVESIERQHDTALSRSNGSLEIENATVNQVRALYLNKDILMLKEDAKESLFQYIWGYSIASNNGGSALSKTTLENPAEAIDTIENIVQNTQQMMNANSLQLNSNDPVSKAIGNQVLGFGKSLTFGNLDDPFPRAGWVSVLVEGPTYDNNLSPWQNLGNFINDIFTGARQQILLSGASYNFSMTSWKNIMNSLYPTYYTSKATQQDISGMQNLYRKFNATPVVQQTQFEERTVPSQQLQTLLSERTVQPQQMETLEPERVVVPGPMEQLESERTVPEQSMAEMEELRNVPDQELEQLGEPRTVIEQTMQEPQGERTIPSQRMQTLDDVRTIDEQYLESLGSLRNIPDQQFENIGEVREIPSQTMDSLGNLRDIPEQSFDTLYPERDIPSQSMAVLDAPRELQQQSFDKLSDPREIKNEVINIIPEIRKIPGFQNIEMDDLRNVPVQKLVELKNIVERSKPNYKVNSLELSNTISKAINYDPATRFAELDKDNIEAENKTLELLKEDMKLINLDESKVNDQNKKQYDIMNFTKLFTENSREIKNAIAENIISMRNTLQNLTTDSIRALPEIDMQVIKKGEVKKEGNDVLMSLTDMEQIDKNIPLMSLDADQVRQLSFHTLIQISNELEQRVKETQALVGLSTIIKEDDDKQKMVMQTLKEVEREEKNKKMMTLLPPREVKNRNVIL